MMGQNDSNDHVENGIKGSFKAALERAKQKAREAAQRKNSLPQMNPDTSVCADSATSDMQISTRLDTITAPAHQSLETEIPIRVAGTSTRRENTNNEASATNIYSSLTSAKKRKLGKVIDSEQTQFEIGPPDTLPPCARQPSLPKMDNRRPFAPPKKPKRKSASYDEIEPIETRTTRRPSDWYENINMKEKFSRSDVETLKYVTTLMRRCKDSISDDDTQRLHSDLRRRIHQMEFYDFITGIVLKKSKVLDDSSGLPLIFDKERSAGVDYPWDIRADAEALYLRWLTGIVDPHLLRGIDTVRKTTGTTKRTTHKLRPDYPGRVPCDHIGAGDLQNGQWWPLQICAMRDGAHGEIEAGIHGKPDKGALSVVMSSGGYADVDDGTSIKYCGTSGSAGKPTAGTNYLTQAYNLKNPVRVLRSSALPASNPYRPSRGLRYDGLYDVIDYEVLDEDTVMYRFSLRRREGQDPIRHTGVEARPTNEEIAEYTKIRALLNLSS